LLLINNNEIRYKCMPCFCILEPWRPCKWYHEYDK